MHTLQFPIIAMGRHMLLPRLPHYFLNTAHSAMGIRMQRKYDESAVSFILNRKWAFQIPDTKIHEIVVSRDKKSSKEVGDSVFNFSLNCQPSLGDRIQTTKSDVSSFYIVRDDLLHPLVNGNKARKLDSLLPLLQAHLVTDVVTCGGCQSAHTAALAVACAERGIRSHLILRGEKLKISTGYNLISNMFGNVVYVPRSSYANRDVILEEHSSFIAGTGGSVMWLHDMISLLPISVEKHQLPQKICYESLVKKVAVVKEGGGDAVALLGLIRLVDYLARPSIFGTSNRLHIVIDSGTGTTAVGIALGVLLLRLPWKVTGIMLADSIEGYKKQEARLVSDFRSMAASLGLHFDFNMDSTCLVHWVERHFPRKFGNVLDGELERCRQISQQTGILVDPIYTLASWEHAMYACQNVKGDDAIVVMLHTGGNLGLFGLAQRYSSFFN